MVKEGKQIRLGYRGKRAAQSGGKPVQMEPSSPSQLLGKRSQKHEEAHSGQLPLEKAKSWAQSQHPML